MAVAQLNARMQMPIRHQHSLGWLFGRDPFGLIAGWRAFRAYEALEGLDTTALARKGLNRSDLPRVALAEIRRGL